MFKKYSFCWNKNFKIYLLFDKHMIFGSIFTQIILFSYVLNFFLFFLWNIKNLWKEILNLQENILFVEMKISKLINYLTNMWFLVVLFQHELYYFWKCWKKFTFKKKNKNLWRGNIEFSRKYSICWNENLKTN
jgi:hypothetical protein